MTSFVTAESARAPDNGVVIAPWAPPQPDAAAPVSANSRQIGGSHYTTMPVQPWDTIDQNFTHEQQVGFYWGVILGYVMRWRAKGGVEDLRKAQHVIDKLIEVEGGA